MTANFVGVASLLNGMFISFALLDLSMAIHVLGLANWSDAASLFRAYLLFRHEAPIIAPMLLFLVLLLPFALYELITEDVIGLFTRPTHRQRHLIGTLNLVGLVVAIALALLFVRPYEDASIAALTAASSSGGGGSKVAAAAGGDDAVGRSSVVAVFYVHVVNLSLNCAMSMLPFFKFSAANMQAPIIANAASLSDFPTGGKSA